MNDIITLPSKTDLTDADDESPLQTTTHTKKKFTSKCVVSERTTSRLVAVQGLYAMEISGKRPSEVILDLDSFQETLLELLDNKKKYIKFAKNIDRDYTISIIRGVVREQRVIDPLISDSLSDSWHFSRIDKVLISILRAGVYEILFSPNIPPKVIINEYTNIASSFNLNDNNALVNGILNAISRENNLL